MTENPLFERPIQTIAAIAAAFGISRITLAQACQHGLFGEDAYQSGATWLIDTNGERFRQWLVAHEQQARVKGRKKRQSPKFGEEKEEHT